MNDLLDLPAASKSIHSAGRVLIRTISSLAATAASDPQQPSVAASLIMAAVHLYVLATCSLVISMLRADLSAAQSTDGFVSIDCGSSSKTEYTDAIGIVWTPDAAFAPDIGGWSSTAAVTPPTGDTTGGEKFRSLRYFPQPVPNGTSSSSFTSASKFCYVLPATSSSSGYYLIRASFWYGTASSATLYSTRVPGSISFRMIVDTYAGQQISVSLPQSAPLTEEMYVRVQDGSTSVSVCFSAADSGGTSDAPFVSALELRPLPADLTSVAMVNKTGTALRRAARADLGADPSAPAVIRYPDDTLDRLWDVTSSTGANAIRTSELVVGAKFKEYVPLPVVQTSFVADSIASGWSYKPALATDSLPHSYYIVLFFAEVDPRVNASGLRVFNIDINGVNFYRALDVFARAGLYFTDRIYSVNPYGRNSSVVINMTPTPSSMFPPFIAGAEILQLLDDPVAPPTSPVDVVGISGIRSAFSGQLGRFSGDPCLPVAYKYPWINCSGQDIFPTRVLSIALSNLNLVGNVPPSINNLDQIVQISLDGNAIEGSLPTDLSNLVNLQVLNLSNNKLTGSIPNSLRQLRKLTYLDIRNNNFTGTIPSSLLQLANIGQLDLRYDGNPFLCPNPNNAACGSPPSSSSKLRLIIGSVAGALVLAIAICILAIICCKRRKRTTPSASPNIPPHPGPDNITPHDPWHSPDDIDIQPAGARDFPYQDIVAATGNFSTILGRGGFGFVYKGIFKDGKAAAIKVLLDVSQQGSRQFLTEVTILSRVHHRNLVQLLGYCTKPKLVLVYEYMPNGSLYDCLFSRNSSSLPTPLTWIQRLQILLGAARGLAYLHGSCNPRIIHMDVKSSNILMDEALEGKMSDFGISRQQSNNNTGQLTSSLMATRGYMDPEFATTLILSEKVDVYSFGVVILEVLCGQRPFIRVPGQDPSNVIHIVDWARNYYQRGDIESILFHGIGDQYNDSAVWKVAEIAMQCVEFEGRNRPTMDEVCNELNEALIWETSYHGRTEPVTEEQLLRPTADLYTR